MKKKKTTNIKKAKRNKETN